MREAIRGHQRPSEAIRGHQRPSEAIEAYRRSTPSRESCGSRAQGSPDEGRNSHAIRVVHSQPSIHRPSSSSHKDPCGSWRFERSDHHRRRGDGAEAAPLHRRRELRRVRRLMKVIRLRHEATSPLVDELTRELEVLWIGGHLMRDAITGHRRPSAHARACGPLGTWAPDEGRNHRPSEAIRGTQAPCAPRSRCGSAEARAAEAGTGQVQSHRGCSAVEP